MRVTKRNKRVKASEEIILVDSEIPVATEPVGKYDEAINCIKCAIDSLCDGMAEGDAVATESIANLSVVLLDLRGNE